jgi:5-methylcytosine-specific restriction endonuclease McrA
MIAMHPFCSQCGRTGSKDNPLSVDHIVPKSRGGTDDLSNLRVLCLSHNQLRNRGPTPRSDQRVHQPLEDIDQDDVWSIA